MFILQCLLWTLIVSLVLEIANQKSPTTPAKVRRPPSVIDTPCLQAPNWPSAASTSTQWRISSMTCLKSGVTCRSMSCSSSRHGTTPTASPSSACALMDFKSLIAQDRGQSLTHSPLTMVALRLLPNPASAWRHSTLASSLQCSNCYQSVLSWVRLRSLSCWSTVPVQSHQRFSLNSQTFWTE